MHRSAVLCPPLSSLFRRFAIIRISWLPASICFCRREGVVQQQTVNTAIEEGKEEERARRERWRQGKKGETIRPLGPFNVCTRRY